MNTEIKKNETDVQQESARKARKKKFKKAWNVIDTVFSWACVIFAVVVLFSFLTATFNNETFYIFGHNGTVILTGSMEPTIKTNAIVITEKVTSPDQIEKGDIITYKVYDETGKTIHICHRIYNIKEDGRIITKGDNNKTADSYTLSMANVDGKVVSIWNGTAPVITKMLDTSVVWFVIPGIDFAVTPPRTIAFVCFLLIVFGCMYISSQIRKKEEEEERQERLDKIEEETRIAANALAMKTLEAQQKLEEETKLAAAGIAAQVNEQMAAQKAAADEMASEQETEPTTEQPAEEVPVEETPTETPKESAVE